MGSGVSQDLHHVVVEESSLPPDGSDLKTESDARSEVIRLRSLIREHALKHEGLHQAASKKVASTGVKTLTDIDFSHFDNSHQFKIDRCPLLRDYLANEFHRYSGKDAVLEWDEFWKFMQDLGLGLNDTDIIILRQKADLNMDGVIDWNELLTVVEPLLSKVWAAKLVSAPEFEQWSELQWETHSKVSKTVDGYTKKGAPFWVNKLTGETSWIMPDILKKNCEIEAKRKRLASMAAPSLDNVIKDIFSRRTDVSSQMSPGEFWKILKTELNFMATLSKEEVQNIIELIDMNADGAISIQEFSTTLAPVLRTIFKDRQQGDAWIAMSQVHDDGQEYLYWYNRLTGESTWTNPASSK